MGIDKDKASSLAGGGAGMMMLATVDWVAVPYGQLVKIAVALVLIFVGYRMYKA